MAYFDKYGVEFTDDRKALVHFPMDFQGGYVIPDSVTEIRGQAFSSCIGLTSIEIPNSVIGIGIFAFSGCTGLTSVVIPSSVESIMDWAFSSCTGLASIVVEEGNTVYDSRNNCNAIIETSSDKLIAGCKKTTIPIGVTSIGDYAFDGCTGLTSLVIPNSVTKIGYEKVFNGCTGLASIVVEEGNTVYDSRNNCNAIIETATNTLIIGCQKTIIPDSVTSIGHQAFYECTGLTSLAIPNSVTSIKHWAFYGCTGLTSLIIPDSVKEIYHEAFCRCTGLASVNIPNGVTCIYEETFYDCCNLTSVIIPNSVTSIEDCAFAGCSRLTSVVIPNSVKHIYREAFKNCSGLTSVVIPNSVTSIGKEVFRGCSNLKEVTVPLGQEERYCTMDGLKDFSEIIRKTSENQKAILRQREAEEQRRMQEQQMQEMMQGSILFFDTETTGTPRNYKAPISDSYNWPRLVQLAWIMADKNGNILKKKSLIIRPSGFTIPADAAAVHGITTEKAEREGALLHDVLDEFETDLSFAEQIVGHNIDFDQHIVGAELYRLGMNSGILMDKPCICTMKSSTDFCAIPNPNSYYGGYKWPSLQELYRKLFNRDFSGAHDALADITATKECFFELKQRGII